MESATPDYPQTPSLIPHTHLGGRMQILLVPRTPSVPAIQGYDIASILICQPFIQPCGKRYTQLLIGTKFGSRVQGVKDDLVE